MWIEKWNILTALILLVSARKDGKRNGDQKSQGRVIGTASQTEGFSRMIFLYHVGLSWTGFFFFTFLAIL